MIFNRISRRSHVAPFIAMDVLSEAAALERQGRRIIHMEVGEPAAAPPRAVCAKQPSLRSEQGGSAIPRR
jgi:aspartate/methionine/tyrosine aminotransferase